MTAIGHSSLEVNKDGVYIIAKNSAIPLREQLTEEELKMWGSNLYLNHMEKKLVSKGAFKANHDELFIAVSKNKNDYSKGSGIKEKGIKIKVGAPKKAEE